MRQGRRRWAMVAAVAGVATTLVPAAAAKDTKLVVGVERAALATVLIDDPAVAAIDRDPGVPDTVVLTLRDGASTRGVAQRLAARDDVRWAAPQQRYGFAAVGDDPLLPQQWNLAAVRAPAAWTSNLGATPAPVAVVDSGVPAPNRDLDGAVVSLADGDPNPADVYGHATAVTGVLASRTDDAFGLAGIAPAAKVLPVNAVQPDGAMTDVSLAGAIVRATRAGARIVNLSIVGPYSRLLHETLSTHPEVLFVSAAGNDGEPLDGDLTHRPFPCGADLDNVLCVGATGRDGALAPWSNTSESVIDVSAPGEDVLAPTFAERDVFVDHFGTRDGWTVSGGTLSGDGALVVTPSAGSLAIARTKVRLPVAHSDCRLTFRHIRGPADAHNTVFGFSVDVPDGYPGGSSTAWPDGEIRWSTGHMTQDAYLVFSNVDAFAIDDVVVRCRFPLERSERQTTVSGTSFATPLVAGAAQLVAAQHPDWTPAQITAAITCTATPAVGVPGSGILDAAAAATRDAAPLRAATAGQLRIVHPPDDWMGSAADASGLVVAPDGSAWWASDDGGLSHFVPGRDWSLAVPVAPTSTGDGGPASKATISRVTALRAMADGGVVFGDGGKLRRIWPDGRIDAVASGFGAVIDVSPAADGGFVVADGWRFGSNADIPVKRIAPDGTVQQIRGYGERIAAEPGGTTVVLDRQRLYRLFPDGHEEWIAGNGDWGAPTGDGGPAKDATLGQSVTRLQWTPNGIVLGLSDGRARIVQPDGTITRFAGTSGLGTPVAGPATATPLGNLQILGRDADGTFLAGGGAVVHVSDAQVEAPPLPPACADVSGPAPSDDGGHDAPSPPAGASTGEPTTSGGGPATGGDTPVVGASGSPAQRPAQRRARRARVKVKATLRARGGRIVLTLTLPRKARIVVRCAGRGCGFRRVARTLRAGTHRWRLLPAGPRARATVTIVVGGARPVHYRVRGRAIRAG